MSRARTLITENIATWTGAIQAKSTAGRGSSNKYELYGIKKLRELILELAVRGKLVPQDPNDEPASVLLERIAAEKAELIKQGKIKKSKALPPVSDEEKPFELPEGWEWTCLGEIAEVNPRNGEIGDNTPASFIPMPMISTSHTGNHDSEERAWGDIKKGYTHFADGDIAIAKITPCFENSKAAIFSNLKNGVGAGTTELHVARPIGEHLEARFILLHLKSSKFLSDGESQMTGSAGQKRVPKSYFESNLLPLPPFAEQQRIVQKVDELMALCDQLEQQTESSIQAHAILVDTLLSTLTNSANADELQQNWARIAGHFDTLLTTEQSIDAFKQTILQLAVMGKLVRQNPDDEPASVLLERIAAEKDRLVKENKIKKQKPLPEISEDEKPFELPEGWVWTCIREIAEVSPRNSNIEDDTPVSFIPMPMISKAYDGNHQSEERTWGEIKKGYTHFANGDIAIAKITPCFENSKAAIFSNLKNGVGAGTTELHVARLFGEYIEARFILLHLKSPKFLSDGESKMTGSAGQKRVPKIYFESSLLALPPAAEQQRIVTKIDELMTLCDQLKDKLRQSQQTQVHLADAIVEKAMEEEQGV